MNQSQKILIVDDDPDVLFGTSRVLKKAGYMVLEARTGLECIRLAENHIPELILLDVVLPDISGFDICGRLKDSERTSQIFISMISGKRIASPHQTKGLMSGADEYITRPIQNNELLARVKAMFRLISTEKKLKHQLKGLRELVEERSVQLQQEEAKFRNLVSNLPGTAYQFAVNAEGDFRFDFIDESCIDLFGISDSEILADISKMFDLIPQPDADQILRAIEKSAKTLTPYKIDHRVIKKNGQVVWIHASSIPRKLPNGDIVWDGIALDITKRKLTEENMRIYKNIVSSTPDGIAYLDRNYKYIIVNDSYEAFSGIRREKFIGLTVAAYLGEKAFLQDIKPNFDRCLCGETVRFQGWFDYPTLGKRFVDITYFPYRDWQNHIVGVVASTRDITQLKKIEESLHQAYNNLELRQKIAKLFLTFPKDQLFSEIIALLFNELNSQYGYICYMDETGDIVSFSLNQDDWAKCQLSDKSYVSPKNYGEGIWGESLKRNRSMVRNTLFKSPEKHLELDNSLFVPLLANGKLIGQVAVANKVTDYTRKDKKRLESIAEFIAPILKMYVEKEDSQRKLQSHVNKLEERNIALKVLLENQDLEKKRLAEIILQNFERRVFPYYEKLKACHSAKDRATFLNIIEANTHCCLFPLENDAPSFYKGFTPTEIQVADLIKVGLTSKEIARKLNISPRAVFFHRNNIRKKLGLHNAKTNLRTFLNSLY